MSARPSNAVRSVAIGADHGAVEQKALLVRFLSLLGYRVVDVGTSGSEKVDYPDIAVAVCRKLRTGDCERGIVLDGAGIGSCMAANKIRGIRAALCHDLRTVLNSRQHNDANVLALGGPLHPPERLAEMAKVWLETGFEGGRHIVRINKMMAIERGGSDG
ncbi:MAG TPA: RpiB/LacA/LacB family sugar-phosphate isomerase [Magnetospirillaceae bacterium]|nr:RpiB/LacA/LacB family sugar-phosphate isomerase [Magnetospirillaceae bacterium]